MRHLHIVDTTLFFAPHSGGVKRYLLAKNQHLNNMPGVRHTLLVPGERTSWVAPGVRQLRAPRIPGSGGYRIPWRLRAWRNELCELQPNIVEAGDPYHLAWMVRSAADHLGVPAVAFVHSDASRLLGSVFGSLAENVAERYLRKLYAGFDLVMAPSQVVAAKLRSQGIERVVRQPLGVDGSVFNPRARDPDLRGLLGLRADTRLLAFAGRIASEKRIPLLRDVVERLGPPYHLLLIGGEQTRRASPNVTELPYQSSPHSIARLLASADALLHVGVHETFGLVILEAMACGRPVVGIDTGAIAELVDDAVGGLADDADAESVAEAVRILYDRDLDALGANARKRVEQHYTWDRIFAQQLEHYVGLEHDDSSIGMAVPEAS
jgi:alpha-1,6-mannosyltransferase